MNELESQLDYPFHDTLPAPGVALEIAPGLRWLRMPLPFALDHINLWLLKDERDGAAGWSAVDCGVANEPTRAAWEQVFTAGMDGLPLLRVVATHCHPDHVGLAEWLCQRWRAPLWMTAAEYAFARLMSAGLPGADAEAALNHFQRHGLVDPVLIEQMQARKNYYPSLVPVMPAAYTRLQDGQQLCFGGADGADGHRWRVITGFGHAPEHAALYCGTLNLLISGDMVLPRISTNVSVFAIEPEANPLRLYLDSLGKFADLPHDTLVLPSHGKPFRGLHRRIAQLREHHRERLAEVAQACCDWQSAAQIVPLMFRRPLDVHQLGFALGEALAHLHYLWNDGVLRRQAGPDGVLRFQMIEGKGNRLAFDI